MSNIKVVMLGVAAIALLATLFVGFLWWTIRTSVTDVSKESPYAELLNRELRLNQQVDIGMNRVPETYERRVFLATDFEFYDEVPKIGTIPEGTPFRFTAAKTFHNGVSGFTWRVLLGTIRNPTDDKTYEFEYLWGRVGGDESSQIW